MDSCNSCCKHMHPVLLLLSKLLKEFMQQIDFTVYKHLHASTSPVLYLFCSNTNFVYAFSHHVALPQKENPLCLYHLLHPSKTLRYCTAVLPAVAHSTEVRYETEDRPTTMAQGVFQCTHKIHQPWAQLDASLYSTNSHQSLAAGMRIIVRPSNSYFSNQHSECLAFSGDIVLLY